MKILSRILMFVTLIGVMSCTAVKIPRNVEKAKKTVAQNVRQIEAIVDYHSLRNPFIKVSDVVINVPEKIGSFRFPDRLATDLDYLYNDYIFPAIPDTIRAVEIKEKIKEVVSNNKIDYTYLDSLIKIQIKGTVDGVDVQYTILQQDVKKTIETEVYSIDTKVRWYEDSYFRIILLFALALITAITIHSIIKREGNPPRPPSLFE